MSDIVEDSANCDSDVKLKRSPCLDENRGMKIRSKDIQVVTRATVPRTVVRSKTYRNLVGQWVLGPCGSNEYYNDSIVEEDEELEMLEGGPSNELDDPPARPAASTNHEVNGEDWRAEDSSDKEDDDEVEEAHLRPAEGASINPDVTNPTLEPPEIRVTVDESLHQMAQEYRGNFDGFAEINRFKSIEDMHEFIKNTIGASPSSGDAPSKQQEDYLDLLLSEKPEDRFSRLFETSRATVRRVLATNEEILNDLFSSATLENFPCPLAPVDEYELSIDDDNKNGSYDNSRDVEVEENMKRWYMIEMIGLWLKLITDVKGYRESIKMKILMRNWGIENDRYEGIAVPLKYK